ncbi:ARMT1-like domain-containing protein [Rubrivirga marina]|uniref:Damage-control phosphatase ARMT1-like metal-binding domain-containing protein n=1 Tax=Rubrivirga marina TaxID=1196024 RepID=A0A271IVR3_9BACT|nr:ARMT1-like domain-containing protein [Rubrivirga marina]PAP75008.1 hypothetical protein BSZ37_00350 [Rubrivirga marina]
MPRPPAVRTDGSNAFAHVSMRERVPRLLHETADRNADAPWMADGLRRLADAIAADAPLPHLELAPDADLWRPIRAAHDGESWLDTEWLFAEYFAYRMAMDAARYLDTGRDPFAPVKRDEMTSDALWEALADGLDDRGEGEGVVARTLRRALWGNRLDLSIAASAAQGTAAHEDHLLADHAEAAEAALRRAAPGTVHVVMDNAGTEQVLDYVLADLLLEHELAERVVLHVKALPVLVSDAIVPDVHALLDLMVDRGGEPAGLAGRLRQSMEAGRLRVVPDVFWNTPGRFWDLPPRLGRAFAGASLVVLKGDANYRRATNDAIWPLDATLADALGGFPAPVVALRTIKSDTLVGVDPDRQRGLDAAEPDWRTSGTYGVVQFVEPGASA